MRRIARAGRREGGGNSKARRVLTVAVAGFFVTASLPTMATAASSVKDVIVSNPDSDPVPTKAIGTTNVGGTVNVGNLPATQTVAGTVSVGNLPETQEVTGSVSIDNLPATQAVSGTVGIDPAANTVSMQQAPAHIVRRLGNAQSWGSWAAGVGYSYFAFANVDPPAGQTMQVRRLSARVTVPNANCTVLYVSVTQLGNDGGASGIVEAKKVGANSWIATGETLVPNAYSAVASVLCPDGVPPTGGVSMDASMAGDLFPAA